MSSEFIFSWVLKVHSLHPPLTNHIKLITKVSVASALLALTVSGRNAEAQSLTAIQLTNISGSAEFGLKYGESFNVSAQEIQQSGSSVNFKPFETTVGSSFVSSGSTNNQGDNPSVVGNAGQSSLTLTYDRTGFLPIQECPASATDGCTGQNAGNAQNVKGDGSITALAGITPFGGDGQSGGLLTTNVPPNIRLNQDTSTGLPGIEFTEFTSTSSADSSTGSATPSVSQNGASITATLNGASAVTASVITQSNIINSLSTSVFD